MVRTAPPDRFWHLIDVAAEVFIAQGYRRTQMDDVAEALGVAKGTVYACVESKAALFDAAVNFADHPELLPQADALPLKTPPFGATLAKLQSRLSKGVEGMALAIALNRHRPPAVFDEFSGIVRDLYDRLERNRRTIKIIDRCALDQPELATLWFGDGRTVQLNALSHYLEMRSSEGVLRRPADIGVAARIMIETIVFWAVHRHWDAEPQRVPEEQIPSILIDVLFHGLSRECS